MNTYDDRISKLDIFKAKSTYQNDYKKFPVEKKRTRLECKAELFETKAKPPRKYVPQDHETFANRRPNVHIPFNLLWTPKPIIQTNPYEPFSTPVMPETADKEAARKTRPRIYMSPAVSIDDIEDPETRKLICDHMYTPEWTKAIQESAVQATKRDIPNTVVETGDNIVRLKVDLLPPLPHNFRNKGKDWENAQLKLSVDPTKTFWQHKDPPVKCGACSDPVEGLVPEETKQEIRELIKQDRLRLPHDLPIPGYAGYKPRFCDGIPLAKVDMPVVHPFVTVAQAINKRISK